jgi:hypothetical protein
MKLLLLHRIVGYIQRGLEQNKLTLTLITMRKKKKQQQEVRFSA